MDEIKEYFEQNSSWWVNKNYGKDTEYYPVGENRLRLLMEMLDSANLRGKDVLDIGSGGGNVSFELARKGYNVVGVDRSLNMVTIACDKKKQLDFQTQELVEFYLSEFDDIAQVVGDKKFDVIVAMGFIGYIGNDDLFFKNIAALLKPNGMLFVSCRNRLFNMFEGSKYRKSEIENGGAKELLNEIEELYKEEIDEQHLMDFQYRLKKMKEQDLTPLCRKTEVFIKEHKVQDITLKPRQHTPNGLKIIAEKYGLCEYKIVGVHPHLINARLNAKGMPQIFKVLSDSLCAFEKLPISLTWSSVFISCFIKK